MEQTTKFTVENGVAESDCMDVTLDFIKVNLKFLNDALKPIKRELTKSQECSFVCYEENWSFAASIERMELGMIASAKGVLVEGNECAYPQVFSALDEI